MHERRRRLRSKRSLKHQRRLLHGNHQLLALLPQNRRLNLQRLLSGDLVGQQSRRNLHRLSLRSHRCKLLLLHLSNNPSQYRQTRLMSYHSLPRHSLSRMHKIRWSLQL